MPRAMYNPSSRYYAQVGLYEEGDEVAFSALIPSL
jgi:hypothetical protein